MSYLTERGAEWKRLYIEEEKTLREIGDRYGVAKTTVKKILVRLGVPIRPAGRRLGYIVNQDRRATIVRLRKEGLGIRQIARQVGIDYRSVQAQLCRAGLKPTFLRQSVSPQRAVVILWLRLEGETINSIVAKTGATSYGILNCLREYGMPKRQCREYQLWRDWMRQTFKEAA